MTVLIDIVNSQDISGELQEITSGVKGEYVRDENGFSLCYDDDKLGGRTTVTVSDGDFVSVCRVGSGYDTEMFFEKNRVRPFVYTTPFGELILETKTLSVRSFADRNGGFVEFEYDLLSGGEKQSFNRMKIRFSEEKDV